ncbi:MAG TPA: hypothetical protein VHX19_18970, partial [Stellaceae bacterium]|nr:hypothetical protein [Stellaceae bacterium]
FIYTKELMHVFDEENEKAGDEKTFDIQIEKFADPNADTSPQYRAEGKAFWRALAVLCPEQKRQEFKEKISQGTMSYEVVSASIRVPAKYVRELMRPDFETIIGPLVK